MMETEQEDREPHGYFRPSILFTEEEAASINWDAVFEKWGESACKVSEPCDNQP